MKLDNPIERTETLTAFNGVKQKAVDITYNSEKEKYDVVSVTYVIYLNGWDEYCFDACRGQSFSVAVEFSTEAPKA